MAYYPTQLTTGVEDKTFMEGSTEMVSAWHDPIALCYEADYKDA